MAGIVVLPDSPEYESLRRPAIPRFADTRPAAIIRCATAADVVEALAYARRARQPVAVRSGGHSLRRRLLDRRRRHRRVADGRRGALEGPRGDRRGHPARRRLRRPRRPRPHDPGRLRADGRHLRPHPRRRARHSGPDVRPDLRQPARGDGRARRRPYRRMLRCGQQRPAVGAEGRRRTRRGHRAGVRHRAGARLHRVPPDLPAGAARRRSSTAGSATSPDAPDAVAASLVLSASGDLDRAPVVVVFGAVVGDRGVRRRGGRRLRGGRRDRRPPARHPPGDQALADHRRQPRRPGAGGRAHVRSLRVLPAGPAAGRGDRAGGRA